MAQKIVEIADLKTGGKNDELVTYALGSCVGICMYDERLHIGGLLHAMLWIFDQIGRASCRERV